MIRFPFYHSGRFRAVGAVAIVSIALAAPASAQFEGPPLTGTTRHKADDPEAWAMFYFASSTLLSGYGPPAARKFGWIDLGLEMIWIPFLDPSYRTIGFGGVKEENLNNAPIGFRPRMDFYLRDRISVTVSYLPPIETFDLKAHLLSGSLNWRLWEHGPLALGLRAYAQTGEVEGPFTCNERQAAVGFPPETEEDFEANPWGCTRVSEDVVKLDYYGGELSVRYRLDRFHGISPFFAVGWNHFDTELRLNSTLFGEPDKRVETAEENTVTYSWGIIAALSDRFDFGLQFFYAPLNVVRDPFTASPESENDSLFHFRAMITYHLGNFSLFGKKDRRRN